MFCLDNNLIAESAANFSQYITVEPPIKDTLNNGHRIRTFSDTYLLAIKLIVAPKEKTTSL